MTVPRIPHITIAQVLYDDSSDITQMFKSPLQAVRQESTVSTDKDTSTSSRFNEDIRAQGISSDIAQQRLTTLPTVPGESNTTVIPEATGTGNRSVNEIKSQNASNAITQTREPPLPTLPAASKTTTNTPTSPTVPSASEVKTHDFAVPLKLLTPLNDRHPITVKLTWNLPFRIASTLIPAGTTKASLSDTIVLPPCGSGLQATKDLLISHADKKFRLNLSNPRDGGNKKPWKGVINVRPKLHPKGPERRNLGDDQLKKGKNRWRPKQREGKRKWIHTEEAWAKARERLRREAELGEGEEVALEFCFCLLPMGYVEGRYGKSPKGERVGCAVM
jgi:hypothetical protein